MKTIKLLRINILFAFFIAFAFSACEGPEGVAGNDGIDGNANVNLIKLSSSDITWVLGAYLQRTSNVFTLTDDRINQDIINHGIVLGYAKYTTSSFETWFMLPLDYEQDITHATEYIKFTYSLNTINLYAFSSGDVSTPPNNIITEYRFIIISDQTINIKSTISNLTTDKLEINGLNCSDYHAVCSYFGIDP